MKGDIGTVFDSGVPGMLRIAFFVIPLVVAPFLKAEGTYGSDAPSKSHPTIYVFSDYSGALYMDREKTGELRALADDPLEIFSPGIGDHLLQQRMPDGEIINCDVRLESPQDAFVYLHVDHSQVEYSPEDENYQPQIHKKTWVYFVVAGGVLAVAALGVIFYEASKTPPQSGGLAWVF